MRGAYFREDNAVLLCEYEAEWNVEKCEVYPLRVK
jgi:hypothetical protein